MLRSNSSVGGKLLLIFITFLLTIALIVGAVFIVYKKVQVKSIANILGADSLISESYDGTIEDFVKLLSDTLSDGSVALDDLTAISPFVGDAVNGVLDDVEGTGLVAFDRGALFATPLNELSSSVGSLVAVTATLNALSETLGFSLPDMPLLAGSESEPLQLYTWVNNTETGRIDTEFTFGGSAEYTFYTRSESYESTFASDEGTQPIAVWEEYGLFTARSVAESDGGTLTHDGYTLYLRTESAGSASYTPLTADSAAVYSYTGGTARFALTDGEAVYVRTGEQSYASFAESFPTYWTDEDSAVFAPSVAAEYKYTPLYYYDTKSNGYLAACTQDGTGKYVTDSERGGFALTLPHAAGQDGYYTQQTTLYALTYTYSAPMTAEEADALIGEALDAGLEAPAVYTCTNGVAALPATYAITALSSALDTDAITLETLCSYVGISLAEDEDGAAAGVLDSVRYVPLDYFGDGMQAELQNIALGDVLSLNGSSPQLLLFLAYGEEGVDYTVNPDNTLTVYNKKTVGELASSLNTLRIGDLIEVDADSAAILQAVQDWTLADFSDPAKLGALTLGDVLTVDENSPAILQALKDVALDGMEEAVNTLTLGDVLGDRIGDSELLTLLRGSTLETLASDISSLALQTMFADSVYAYYEAGTVADYTALAARYGAENLYVLDGVTYVPYSADGGYGSGETLYSPYRPLEAGELADYAGVPLYTFTNGEMQLATDVTGWSMTEEQFAAYGGKTLYYEKDGTDPVGSFTQDTVFTTAAVWYWDPASETMQRISLTPAAYGIAGGTQSGTEYFTRLTRAGAPETHGGTDYYAESNLYCYDVATQSWKRVLLTGVWLDGSGNEVSVTDETDTSALTRRYKLVDGQTVPDGAALYTYGDVLGMWKYLLKDENGFEQTYTLEDVNSMVLNINKNINGATLSELVADGIVTINVTPGEGQTEEEAVQEILNTPLDALGQTGRVLGDCTTGELIALMAEIIGTLG